MFYSKSTGGFYDRSIHGDNIPTDAVEITNGEHADLLVGQSQGKLIVADGNGHPVLVENEITAPTSNQVIIDQIKTIEATVTQRRIREAVLGVDNGWLAATNAEITTMRAGLQ